jgi:predicted acylesterase/phospholipase RssA
MTATTSSKSDETPASVRRDRPAPPCDVVMKGGVTSGVVYPYAVAELANSYRLKNVGGTSAGAIAAAVAAAAEYGRERGGYDELAALPISLGTDGKLKSLFAPQKATRGLYALVLAAIEHRGPAKPLWMLASALRWFPISALIGAAPGAAVLWLALRDGSGALEIVAAVAGCLLLLLGAMSALAARVGRKAMRAIPANGFGLCSGMADRRKPEALTPWLAELIDRAARRPEGLQGPLTFGDLWAGPGADRATAKPEDAWLRLEMVTTNVTNHRAERLPSASREYYFHAEEFRDLFPEAVVRWMIEHPPPLSTQAATRRDQELRRRLMLPLLPMPHATDLPVIVATRMSLSFPVLLSAVPLWRVDFSLERNIQARTAWRKWLKQRADDWEQALDDPSAELPAAPEAERCWFSDGGISSNFPVHFFDAYLPRHPTFAINLRPFGPDTAPPEGDAPSPPQSEHVWMADKHPDGIDDWWYRFDGKLAGFLTNIVRTMQNRVDDAQMRVPGYRDRIVHVSLSDREGGTNLDMRPEVIGALTARGLWAGRRLVGRFAHPPPTPDSLSWEDHRWVRFRTTFAALAEVLEQLSKAYARPPEAGGRTYAQLLAHDPATHPTSYKMTDGQRALAARFSEGVAQLVEELQAAGQSLATRAPGPPPTLRMVPQDAPLRAVDPDEE